MADDNPEGALNTLTDRQKEVLRLVGERLSSKEIARALGLSVYTVNAHVVAARRKLKGLSRQAAARVLGAWEASKSLARDGGAPPIGIAPASESHQSRGIRSSRAAKRRLSHVDRSNRQIAMLAVAGRAVIDAIYISLFFLVMSLVAYGAHQLVGFAERAEMDAAVVFILHGVEVALAGIDGIGVVVAALILTFRFVVALFRADNDHFLRST